jgi:hypothetical protein
MRRPEIEPSSIRRTPEQVGFRPENRRIDRFRGQFGPRGLRRRPRRSTERTGSRMASSRLEPPSAVRGQRLSPAHSPLALPEARTTIVPPIPHCLDHRFGVAPRRDALLKSRGHRYEEISIRGLPKSHLDDPHGEAQVRNASGRVTPVTFEDVHQRTGRAGWRLRVRESSWSRTSGLFVARLDPSPSSNQSSGT